MAVGTFFPKTDLFYSTVNVVNRDQTISGLITSIGIDCCTETDKTCCPTLSALNYLLSNVGDITVGKLVTTPEYFGFINGFFDVLNNYANIQDESKNGFMAPMAAIDTANYNYTSLEFNEQTNYYKYGNVFGSGINVPPSSDDINYYVSDPTGAKFIPLMKVTPTDFSKIENINLTFKFYGIPSGAEFIPPVLELWLVEDPNNGSGAALTKVGATMKIFDVTTPIGSGGIVEYRYNIVIPAAFYNLVSVDKTFDSTGTGSINNWSDFVNAINGKVTNTNTVYYFALTTATVSAGGKGWFEIISTAKFSSTGDCTGPCRIDGYGKDAENGDCYKCATDSTDSSFWTAS